VPVKKHKAVLAVIRLRQQKPAWMTTTPDGGRVSDQNPLVWMNPLRPACRDFLMGIVLDAVDRCEMDGARLDDRIAWPVTMGCSASTPATPAPRSCR